MRIIQLVGVLGSSSHTSNAQALVELMARKVGGEGVYLYTPLIVENAETARSLLKNQHVRETIEAARKCVIALLGVGTTDPETCSLYHSGHISAGDLEALRAAGAVGDVNAYYFDIEGRAVKLDFDRRVVGVPRDDLLQIETRLGVAGGVAKAHSILGALRGKYINLLVTDSTTTQRVLELDSEAGAPCPP